VEKNNNRRSPIVGVGLVRVYSTSELTHSKPTLSSCYVYLYPLYIKVWWHPYRMGGAGLRDI